MKYFSLLLTCFFILAESRAQSGSVSGSAYESAGSKRLADVTVTILKRKDSSLVSFNMTSSSGYFRIMHLAEGEYRLLASHVGYHNFSKNFTITEAAREVDLGILNMQDQSVVLQEVVVSSEAPPVSMVGDTVQYHADAFRTQPNANVEQLLKKLPGLQVDKDGNIKANGQDVKKVLVDGKEFFGNDPKMATRNLPADAIDKVQMYDRQSDQSMLTGFDDGNSEKTINLKLKKEKKKGVFGKVSAGAGSDKRMEGRFNLNSFQGARQLSAVGMGNNTNTEGFSFSDMMNFSGALGRIGQGGATLSQGQMAALAAASSTNQGIRSIYGGGLNYNNIIGQSTDFTSSYFYNNFSPKTSTDLERTFLLPDSVYNYRQQQNSYTNNNSHRLNLGFDHRIDSFHSIKVTPSLGLQRTASDNRSRYMQSGSDGRLSNSGYNNYVRSADAINVRTDVLFRKKFRKKGRTFSLSLQGLLNDSDGESDQESVNEYFPFDSSPYRDSINQHSYDQASQHGLTGRAVYTEPLSGKSLLEFSVGKSYITSTSAKQAYDYNKSTNAYDQLNDSLSNDFKSSYGYTNAGLRVRSVRGKLSYSAGITWQSAMLEGKVVAGLKASDLSKDFNNLLPNARAQYTFIRNKSLTLNYSTYTQQPSVSQLQPVPDISNALNIYEGNPALKQEFTHNLTL
ncbi:MAG: TonB-dependent receptor, partial [Chitinophagaceae bacterium]